MSGPLSLKLAGQTIYIRHCQDYTHRLCRDYQIPPPAAPDLVLTVSASEIRAEQARCQKQHPQSRWDFDYAESVALYRKLCLALPARQTFVLHAAVVAHGGRGYAFAGKSGVGKSTHARQWRDTQGAVILNGDKPLIRQEGQGYRAYGTPWCGKEGWHANASIPLAALCFLEQSPQNHIRPLGRREALEKLCPQLLFPEDPAEQQALLALAGGLLQHVPSYQLACNTRADAVATARAVLETAELPAGTHP